MTKCVPPDTAEDKVAASLLEERTEVTEEFEDPGKPIPIPGSKGEGVELQQIKKEAPLEEKQSVAENVGANATPQMKEGPEDPTEEANTTDPVLYRIM